MPRRKATWWNTLPALSGYESMSQSVSHNQESFELAKADDRHTNILNVAKGTIYTVTDNNCTCPSAKYHGTPCKHMRAVEQERVSGPYTGYDKYGNIDHHYWTCERCGAEATDKSGLEDCC